MRIDLNVDETKSLIKKYYESKNESVEVELNSSIAYEGFYEDKTAKAKIVVKKKINIMGIDKETEETLTKDEVLGIFNEMLKDAGLEIRDLRYKTGINQGGSYTWESQGSTAYFNGIELEVVKEKRVENYLSR